MPYFNMFAFTLDLAVLQRWSFAIWGNANGVKFKGLIISVNFPFHLVSMTLKILQFGSTNFEKRWLYTNVGQRKKEIFPLKRALDETERRIRWLSNHILSFRLKTQSRFLTYVHLTFMLHYRIHGFLLTELLAWN